MTEDFKQVQSDNRQNRRDYVFWEEIAKSNLRSNDFEGAIKVWKECFDETNLVVAITNQARIIRDYLSPGRSIGRFVDAANLGSTEAMVELALVYVSLGTLD